MTSTEPDDLLDLRAIAVPGAYFVRNDTGDSPFVAATEPEAGGYRHCYTYGDASTIRQAAIELIDQAREKVFVASFRLGDKELLAALYRAARRLRGGVYVITEIGDRSLRAGLHRVSELDAVGDDEAAQNKRFPDLTAHGIWVRGHEHCHAKFLVVDDRAALVSSANLEYRALHVTGENGVLIDDPVETDRAARFFTRLWYTGCTWEVPPGPRGTYQAGVRRPAPSPCRVPLPGTRRAPGLIWTHDNEQSIHHALLDIIDLAREDLLLATFSLVGLAKRPDLVTEPLRRALDRGVLVRMLVRSRNNVREHRDCARLLHEMGVEVYGDPKTHAKGVIADRAHGALFSANLDAEHGIFSGVEMGVRLDGDRALADAADFFTHSMRYATFDLAVDPTQARLSDGLGARWRKPWPLADRTGVQASDSDWQALRAAADRGPVLFQGSPDDLTLHGTGGTWHLTPLADGAHRLTRTAGDRAALDTAQLLETWLATRGRQPVDGMGRPVPAGLCSGVFQRRPPG